MKSDPALVGAAGEHLVLSRLLAQGLLASQSPFNAYKADILVNPTNGGNPVLIQVKTRNGINADSGWHMGVKHETIEDKNMFYCFVAIEGRENAVYIIPAKRVAQVVRDSHQTWLKTPGAKGQKHNDTKMRFIKNRYRLQIKSAPEGWMDEFLERWDLLT